VSDFNAGDYVRILYKKSIEKAPIKALILSLISKTFAAIL
jgi:hypothetical protein